MKRRKPVKNQNKYTFIRKRPSNKISEEKKRDKAGEVMDFVCGLYVSSLRAVFFISPPPPQLHTGEYIFTSAG